MSETNIISTAFSRIIGRVEGSREGPVLFVMAGIHGNEPAGIEAVERVCSMLKESEEQYKGKLIGVRSNLRALEEGVRFIDEDMNRLWFPSIVDKIRRSPAGELESNERVEIKEFMELIDREVPDDTNHPVIFVDLHSFSSEGSMFAISAPTEYNIDILSALHTPTVFGIEEALRGTALRYFQERGYVSFAFEGGNHQNSVTVYNKIALLMLLVSRIGSLIPAAIPGYMEYDRHLRETNIHLPARVELIYQHIIEEGDRFVMRKGYKNFQPVKEGEWLADDRSGKIRAQCDGFILMPLYQQQGNDGFFIVRESA